MSEFRTFSGKTVDEAMPEMLYLLICFFAVGRMRSPKRKGGSNDPPFTEHEDVPRRPREVTKPGLPVPPGRTARAGPDRRHV